MGPALQRLLSIAPPRSQHFANLLAMLALALLSVGCASLPEGRSALDSVEFQGNDALDDGDIEEKIATRPSPRFLGLMQGVVYDYEVYDFYVLQRDLERVERLYRARGYYKAKARAARVEPSGDNHVRVKISVEEGPVTRVRRLDLFGDEHLPETLRRRLSTLAQAQVGVNQVFDEDEFKSAEAALERLLTDEGYAYAKVQRTADVDLPGNYASLRFDISPGILAKFGEISIQGLGPLPEASIRRALDLHPGDPYSTSELEAAQQAVLDLGVLSNVHIESDLSDATRERVPLVVHLEPSKLHQLRLGVGSQIDVIRTDIHALVGWDHNNFLGGLRRLSLEAKPGVVLYPTRFPSFKTPTNLLPEVKTRAELTQPGFLEARTNAFLRVNYDIYAALLSSEIDENAPVLGYRELKGALGVDRSLWRFYFRPSHNIGLSVPFTYIGQLDPDLDRVLVSFLELFTSFDLRDDRVDPHKGVYLSNTFQVAGGPLGGDARDFKVQPEARIYVPLGRKLTFATRGSIGLLFPQNYGDTIASNAATGSPPPGTSRADWVRDIQIGFFRSFFSGGPNSNRGYALRDIGPHGVVPFYSPELNQADLDTRCQTDPTSTSCLLPLGGLTLWEASAELRYPITGSFSGATFCDTSDVAPEQVQFRFDRLHLSCGLGARYATPLGPFRADIGYRIPGLQTLNDSTGEGRPSSIFGAPIAVSIALGEAF
ncbi:MAG: BamA/TamA family outer membrane protein [Myxococcales bacterium]|nr:BamA/TamA family outer membrane protein [Myxococcales bacterium]